MRRILPGRGGGVGAFQMWGWRSWGSWLHRRGCESRGRTVCWAGGERSWRRYLFWGMPASGTAGCRWGSTHCRRGRIALQRSIGPGKLHRPYIPSRLLRRHSRERPNRGSQSGACRRRSPARPCPYAAALPTARPSRKRRPCHLFFAGRALGGFLGGELGGPGLPPPAHHRALDQRCPNSGRVLWGEYAGSICAVY